MRYLRFFGAVRRRLATGALRSLGGVRASGEVRTAPERTVISGPLLAGRQLLFDPIEAAEAPAEVVDHVDERRLARARHDRASVLERAVVAEDDVQNGLRELPGNPSIRSIARRTM